MNTYKVNFQRENGTTGFDYFTAPTEAQARKEFKEVYRHGNGVIKSVELTSTDALATREQERKAIEKIKKIVAELGAGSYVGIALEGCLEDAESNIENDFGNSMKARYENSEKEITRLTAALKEATAKVKELEEEIERCNKELEKAKEAILCDDDYKKCVEYAEKAEKEYTETASNAAIDIVKLADTPQSLEFKNAVEINRAYLKKAIAARQVIENLEHYRSKS